MSVKQSKPTPNLESSPGGLGDLVHQFTGTDLTALGQELIVPLGKLKNLRDGAPVHVKSVSVRVTVLMTTVALTMPATTPVLLVRSAIRAIRVEVDGHKFVDGQVDGADVYGDFSKRAQAAYESAEPATIPDADAAGVSRTFIIPLYFVSPAPAAGCENDGAVPLAFFDPQQADPSVLAFSLATTLRGFLGVTITSFTLIDVYADLVPLPELRFPTTHRLYVVTATGELDITTRPTGKIEYAVVADISDANGAFAETATEADYTLEGLWIGDQQMLASRSSAQLIDIFNQKLWALSFPVGTMPRAAPVELPLVLHRRGTTRSKMPSGSLRVKFSARTNHATTRLVIRETGLSHAAQMAKWARRLGAPEDANGNVQFHVETRTAKKTPARSLAPYLDKAVYWPGMKFRKPAQKFERKTAKG